MLTNVPGNQSQASMTAVSPPTPKFPEYIVRVPVERRRQYNIMKFNGVHNIDVTKWTQVSMERENNIKEYKLEEEMPKFGAGSEFGREQREEARRKKYGITLKKYNPDDQPWILQLGGKGGKKYKGLREGGITENASYYVFTQALDGAFEAFPVSEFYNFAPIQRYKALSFEEAEEEFNKRNQVLNYFNVMKKVKKGGENESDDDADDDEGEGKKDKKKKKSKKKDKSFKITEMDDWIISDSEAGSSESGEADSDDGGKKSKGKGKAGAKPKNKKKKEDSNDEALEESDEGDFDDREVDYITNSSSSSEEEPEEKANREMKGVEDEDGLRKLTESGDEEEEEENKIKEEEPEAEANNASDAPQESKQKEKVKKEPTSSGESTSESSDSDFDDDSVFQSAMFMPKNVKKNGSESTEKSTSQSKSTTSKENPKSKAVKRKATAHETPQTKKPKTEATPRTQSGEKPMSELIEEAVIRYLKRKPMTTKDILHKLRKKTTGMSSDDLVLAIAEILKKINPASQKIKGTLYLYIKH